MLQRPKFELNQSHSYIYISRRYTFGQQMYPMKDTIQPFERCISCFERCISCFERCISCFIQYQNHSLFKFFKNIFEEISLLPQYLFEFSHCDSCCYCMCNIYHNVAKHLLAARNVAKSIM